jgi:hypothetical protein
VKLKFKIDLFYYDKINLRMKYITFQENNFKENESFIFFLQYDDNEENLKLLNDYVNYADFSSLYGDYSTFEMDLNTLLDENTVKNICKVNLGSYAKRFQVCKGKFDFPYENFVNEDECETARILDYLFYSCQIRDYFVLDGDSNNKQLQKKIVNSYGKMLQTCEEYLKKVKTDITTSEFIDILTNIFNFIEIVIEKEKKAKFMTYIYKISSASSFDLMPEKYKLTCINRAKELLKECNNHLLYDKDNKIYFELKNILENFLESKKI